LFPRNCKEFVDNVKSKIDKETGKDINVMIYGDGAFKDPIEKIWELADPVVSPGYTDGLKGTPNELKLKYLADTKFKGLKGDDLNRELTNYIRGKNQSLVGNMESEGTTPRQITDLVGSLCDLVSGSGDKGTPVVIVSGYFDNYSSL
ncbi:MAG: coenzyme F420-0:L-glutamate ligase, partial [Oscillospiraceae bacterium]|nr:coenzyme F420-0:L-glutamate ligase [Oscillospiraceae bacterium]